MGLDQIINIQIDRQTRAVSQKGFGTGLILFNDSEKPVAMTTRTAVYNSLEALGEDFDENTEVYKAANKYFGQSLVPEKVVVGRRLATGDVEVQKIDFSAVPDEGSFRLVHGVLETSLIPFGATAADVQTALRALAGFSQVTVTGNFTTGFVVTMTGVLGNPDQFTTDDNTLENTNTPVTITPSTTTPGTTVNEAVATALNAIVDENPDFYFVGMTSMVQADQEDLAEWLSAQRRIGGVRTNDSGAIANTTTDIGAVLNLDAVERCFAFYLGEADEDYPEFAWAGRLLPELPGAATWKFKTLVGVTPDALTATQETNLINKKYNYYMTIGGVNITQEGWMPGGEFIDVMIGVDFIHARMQEAIFSRMVNLKKIPYTNQGVDIIVNEMDAVLNRSINQGILAADPAPVINKPNVRDVPFNDRAARLLPDLTFTAVLAGAIHKVQIRGTVTV